jgi:hypothetical protein
LLWAEWVVAAFSYAFVCWVFTRGWMAVIGDRDDGLTTMAGDDSSEILRKQTVCPDGLLSS